MESNVRPDGISLDDNEDHIIDNPLKRKSKPQLLREAEAFAKRAKASEELFVKATLIARDPPARTLLDPPNWDFVPDLTIEEKEALNREKYTSFWEQPRTLRVTVVTLCFSAIVQGWVQSSSNGANQTWPADFGLIDSKGRWVDDSAVWIFAGVNAVPYLTAGAFGCWLSDPLQSMSLKRYRWFSRIGGMMLGRRGAIATSALLCFASLVGAAFARSWRQLLACRAILGLGLGCKAAITPIYGAEISPSHLRGAIVVNWQLFDAFGIFLGFSANLILSFPRGNDLEWRYQTAAACIPTLCLLALIWTIPESPRWLLKQDRISEAFAAMCDLRETPLQAAQELFYANAQLQIEAALTNRKISDVETQEVMAKIENSNKDPIDIITEMTKFQASAATVSFGTRLRLLFQKPRTRRACIAAATVMLAQQLCGFNVFAFYSSTFVRDINLVESAKTKANWLSWGVGLANFLFTIPASFSIDRRGRRFLLLATYPFMIVCMLAACLSFLHQDEGVRFSLVGVFLFVIVFLYSVGQGPVAFVYSSEVFPLINREAGMSFAVSVNFLGAGLLTLFSPLAEIGKSSTTSGRYGAGQARLLGAFVGFEVVALVLIFFFVPETAGTIVPKKEGELNYLRLEELNYIFGVPTHKHIEYQVTKVLPWAMGMLKWRLTSKNHRPKDNRRQNLDQFYRWFEGTQAETNEQLEQPQAVENGKSNASAQSSSIKVDDSTTPRHDQRLASIPMLDQGGIPDRPRLDRRVSI